MSKTFRLLDKIGRKKCEIHILRDDGLTKRNKNEDTRTNDYYKLVAKLNAMKLSSWFPLNEESGYLTQLQSIDKSNRASHYFLLVLKASPILRKIIQNENCIDLKRWTILTMDYDCENLRTVYANKRGKWENEILDSTYISLIRIQNSAIVHPEISSNYAYKSNSMWFQYFFLMNLLSRLPKENYRSESFRQNFSEIKDNNGSLIFTDASKYRDPSHSSYFLQYRSSGYILKNGILEFSCVKDPM